MWRIYLIENTERNNDIELSVRCSVIAMDKLSDVYSELQEMQVQTEYHPEYCDRTHLMDSHTFLKKKKKTITLLEMRMF